MKQPVVAIGDRYWSIAPFFPIRGQPTPQAPWLGQVVQRFDSGRPGGNLNLVGAGGGLDRNKSASFDLTAKYEPLTHRNRVFASEREARVAYLDYLAREIETARVVLATLIHKRNDLADQWS